MRDESAEGEHLPQPEPTSNLAYVHIFIKILKLKTIRAASLYLKNIILIRKSTRFTRKKCGLSQAGF